MIKTIARFEHKIGERLYHFYCDSDAPATEVYAALNTLKTHVAGIIAEANAPKEDAKTEEQK